MSLLLNISQSTLQVLLCLDTPSHVVICMARGLTRSRPSLGCPVHIGCSTRISIPFLLASRPAVAMDATLIRQHRCVLLRADRGSLTMQPPPSGLLLSVFYVEFVFLNLSIYSCFISNNRKLNCLNCNNTFRMFESNMYRSEVWGEVSRSPK
jgi:hypothetical protein